jgi:amino acid adenylation domain-containing protein
MQNHVLDYLKETVERVPDKVAFADEEISLTFRELDHHLSAIGSALARRGYHAEPVLIYMDRSPQEIATFFGVISAGAFYVPLDEEMPATRIGLIMESCQARVLICQERTAEKAAALGFSGEILRYEDLIAEEVSPELLKKCHDTAIDTDPIYIVFTSGSTGVPKGVTACHRSVLDYVEQLSETLGFDGDTVFGNQTPLYFDACLKELYPTIKFGATTYLIPRELFSFPVKLLQYLNEHRINTICWVVSAMTMISAFRAFDEVKPEYLRLVAFGSEVFPVRQLKIWREAAPKARFFNLYGPTEGTGMCCYYPVEREFEDGEAIPIGRPFKNTQILLLKEGDVLAGEGEEGEICIRGTGVTLGYYNNPEKTASAFVQNPLQKAYPEIIYRTGDIGRRDENGDLIFVSRRDFQIKHMGHRIELGEIEANVNALEGVQLSACIYDREKNRILLFYVGDQEPAELTAQLKEHLPRYMLPNRTRKLEHMPLTANGKLDRKALQQMTEAAKAERKKD